jgi:hypothetical protein
MNKAVIVVPLLGWAAVSALVLYTRTWPDQKASEATVVVVPPTRPADAASRTPLAPLQRAIPADGDRVALVRELQKELKRVGCYDGEISGAWTTSSRRAMRAFTDRVNATLPIDEPDQILLSLVQGHRQKTCGAPCPAGQQDGPDGRCVPHAIAAQAAQAVKKPATPQAAADPPADKSATMITGSAATAAAAATVAAAAMPRPDPNPAPASTKTSRPDAADSARPHRSARQSGPVPPVGVRERRRRYVAHRSRSRPPGVVRSLVRSVQRALGSLGIR